MKKVFIIITVITIAFISGCDEEKIIDTITFEGITLVDEGGVLMGEVDETDWRLDDVWSEKEEAIFNSISYSNPKSISLKAINEISISPAYPNPCSSFVRLSFVLTENTTLKIALVNQSFDIISFVSFDDHLNNTHTTYDLSKFNLKDNTIYRFYYKFELADGSALKGHGDIKFVK